MKKLLNMLGLITLTTLTTNSITACDSYTPGTNTNPHPNPDQPHDVNYYEQQIKNLSKQVTQIQIDINDMNSSDMKQQTCGANTMCQDLQQLIDSSTAELKQIQATVQFFQYQILVLQTNGNFNPQQKLQAIKYLQTELALLTEKLTLMIKVPDYTKDDIQKTNDQILLINTELAKLIPTKELITHVNNT